SSPRIKRPCSSHHNTRERTARSRSPPAAGPTVTSRDRPWSAHGTPKDVTSAPFDGPPSDPGCTRPAGPGLPSWESPGPAPSPLERALSSGVGEGLTHHTKLRHGLGQFGPRVRTGDDPTAGEQPRPGPLHKGAPQRDTPFGVARTVHPPDRTGIPTAPPARLPAGAS